MTPAPLAASTNHKADRLRSGGSTSSAPIASSFFGSSTRSGSVVMGTPANWTSKACPQASQNGPLGAICSSAQREHFTGTGMPSPPLDNAAHANASQPQARKTF